MAIVRNPMKCGKCGEVTIFEISPPVPGFSKSVQFICPSCGKEVANADGMYETVDLKNYDETKLKKVRL